MWVGWIGTEEVDDYVDQNGRGTCCEEVDPGQGRASKHGNVNLEGPRPMTVLTTCRACRGHEKFWEEDAYQLRGSFGSDDGWGTRSVAPVVSS